MASLIPSDGASRSSPNGFRFAQPSLVLGVWFETVTRVLAQVLFSRSRVAGALLLLAMATDPSCAAGGVLAVVLATWVARWVGVSPESVKEGAFGYNALLLGAGIAHSYDPSPASALLLVLSVGLAMQVTAAMLTFAPKIGGFPVLSLPFVVVFWLTLLVAPMLGLVAAPPVELGLLSPVLEELAPGLRIFFESLGALVFAPRAEAGVLVLLALLVHSRISTLLAVATFTLLAVVASVFAPALSHDLELSLALNAMLASMTLGGVYFVPSTSAMVLGLGGGLIATLFAAALVAPLTRLGIPALILPFNLAVISTLAALRQRIADTRPRSVDFEPGSPEQNLRYFSLRLARFDALYSVPIFLPFRGAWECTQAVDGKFTHQGAWRHGFDFEVRDRHGSFFADNGESADDYHCFRLPVLSPGEATVVAVEASVQDNAVGDQELEQNWGNYVVLQHAPGLYSLVAHLAQNSVKVAVGQYVARGDVIALCGSSGRSPRPHLHFQLQGSPVLGAPTLPCRFHDVVTVSPEGERLDRTLEPREGQSLRPLAIDDDLAANTLVFTPGRSYRYEMGSGSETIESSIDLLGRQVYRSVELGTLLYVSRTPYGWLCLDVVGDSRSVLHLFRAALSRVHFERPGALSWTDILPTGSVDGAARRFLLDFASPFLGERGLEIEYRLSASPAGYVVEGSSVERDRTGKPLLSTRAVLGGDGFPVRLEIRKGRQLTQAILASRADDESHAEVGPWALLSPVSRPSE